MTAGWAMFASPWGLVCVAIGVGMVCGMVLIAMLPKTSGDKHLARGMPTLLDVEEAYSRAIDHLKELGERAHTMQPAFVAQERVRMEHQAATLLGQRERLRKAEGHKTPQANKGSSATGLGLVGFLRVRPRLQGAVWGAGAATLAAFLYATVQQGSVVQPPPPFVAPQEAGSAGLQIDKKTLLALQKRIESDPTDVAALLELAHALLRGQMLDEARVVNNRALTLAPNNLEALTHAAVLSAGSGDNEGAHAGLKMVLKRDPGFAEAWFFRGMLSMQAGDTQAMQESFAQFIRYAPDGPQKERVRAMLERSRIN
jgi:cytochrome c-type biogenesis protein CcmH/NrfG